MYHHIENQTIRSIEIYQTRDRDMKELMKRLNYRMKYLKYNERLTDYVFLICFYVSIDTLRKMNFTLSVREISIFLFSNINIMNLLLYLSNDDNFVDFVKLNEKYLMRICNDECKKYIQTFI